LILADRESSFGIVVSMDRAFTDFEIRRDFADGVVILDARGGMF